MESSFEHRPRWIRGIDKTDRRASFRIAGENGSRAVGVARTERKEIAAVGFPGSTPCRVLVEHVGLIGGSVVRAPGSQRRSDHRRGGLDPGRGRRETNQGDDEQNEGQSASDGREDETEGELDGLSATLRGPLRDRLDGAILGATVGSPHAVDPAGADGDEDERQKDHQGNPRQPALEDGFVGNLRIDPAGSARSRWVCIHRAADGVVARTRGCAAGELGSPNASTIDLVLEDHRRDVGLLVVAGFLDSAGDHGAIHFGPEPHRHDPSRLSEDEDGEDGTHGEEDEKEDGEATLTGGRLTVVCRR